ncbi:MAG TPA: 3-oxoacyl-ACP reductase [Azospirillaceae bacterium]|nr:3-oxoacyl-ACP reductase [Azospirillaceae bacterium]
MSDLLLKLANGRVTGGLTRAVGLPSPRLLARADGAYGPAPLAGVAVSLGAAPGSRALAAARGALAGMGAQLRDGLPDGDGPVGAALFDATGCADAAGLGALHDFFHPLAGRLGANARIVVLAADPDACADVASSAAARAVEGFVRSLAKEAGRRGATANLLYLGEGATDRLAAPLRFLLSARSAYVSGQPLRIDATAAPSPMPQGPLLEGKVALVTGAARGLGAATAQRLAEEGARVVCLDVPGSADALERTAAGFGGMALPLDVTADGAPAALAGFLADRFGGVDVLVHNAGITRDKTLARMKRHLWDQVMAVNYAAVAAIDAELDRRGLLRDGGREICLSSISGIAGNFGQTNYAASKAAVAGYAAARAPRLAPRGITVNAVAPGFIETEMTGQVPLMIREAGRRLNALSQGGLPRDVAEAVAFLACPDASGVTGRTLRVCGLALIGA